MAPNHTKPRFASFSLEGSDPASAGAAGGRAPVPSPGAARLCSAVLAQLWGQVPTTAAAWSWFGFDRREATMSSGMLEF